jgi:hypothetical protein
MWVVLLVLHVDDTGKSNNLRPYRFLVAAEWPVWHMLHDSAASNCQLATEDRPNGLLASGSHLNRFEEALGHLPT